MTTTPIGRVSFPSVFEPGKKSGKYEIILVFTPDQDLSALRDLAKNAAVDTWPNESERASIRTPFRLCSEKPEYYGDFPEGSVYMSFKSKKRPGVVDENVQPVIDPDKVYPGCYARVSTGAYAYDVSGNKGVAFGLNNIQFCRDGDRLDGGVSAENEFTAVENPGAPITNSEFPF